MKNVVVTGIGLVAPLEPFAEMRCVWEAICLGQSAFTRERLPLLDLEGEWPMARVHGGLIEEAHVSLEDRLAVMAEAALKMALRDADMVTEEGQSSNSVDLVVGTVLANMFAKEKRLLAGASVRCKGESLLRVCSYLKDRYKFRGIGTTVSTACASGSDAIGVAARRIDAGTADIIVAGGIDIVSDFSLIGFHSLGVLTDDVVRPFDKNRRGLALGEGAAFVVLESRRHADARGVKPHGSILGYASRSDAHHLTGPHREGRGLAAAIAGALRDADVGPDEIGYINAHGTGTVYNDLMETKAIKNALGPYAYKIPVSSTKSMLGHSFGAAGVTEAIFCLLAMATSVIPPTANLEERDPECDIDYVTGDARRLRVKRSLSLSAGFGGQNAVLALGEG